MSRYERQTRFAPFGEEGQQKLSTSQILIFGAGALGSHIVDQLARMGLIILQSSIWILLKFQIYIDKHSSMKKTHIL